VTQFPETRESLILQVKDPANRAAWEQFVDLYRPVIYRIARARGAQNADAEDLAQQVLIAVAGSIGRWEKSDKSTRFRHWVRRIARNAIVNAMTRRPLEQATGSSSVQDLLSAEPARDEPTDALIETELRRELYLRAAKIVRLDINEETWQAFELTVLESMSGADAARELGKSIGTVYAARSRVMKRLRDAIAELEESQS
jgi:RNA polymerase sigma-70 factor (ECF subfamily)